MVLIPLFDMSLGSGVTYLLRDEFTTTAGAPLASPRTCDPGPRTLTLVQTDGQYAISSGDLVYSGILTDGGQDTGYYHTDGLSRVAGRMWAVEIELDQTTLYDSLSLHETANIWLYSDFNTAAGAVAFYPSAAIIVGTVDGESTSAQVGTYAAATRYVVLFCLRANGVFYLIKGGAFTDYTLLFVANNSSLATVYPNHSPWSIGATGKIGFDRVPNLVYTPSPLASDSFNRIDSATLGNTDGAGAEESGGDGLAWTETLGGLDIVSNQMEGTDAEGIAVVDTGQSDVLWQGKVTTGNAATNSQSGPILRLVDSDDYIRVVLDDVANTISNVEVVAGTPTTRGSTAVAIATATQYNVLTVVDGTSIFSYLNGGSRTPPGTLGADTGATKHGFRNNETGAVTAYAKLDDFVIWPRTLTNVPSF